MPGNPPPQRTLSPVVEAASLGSAVLLDGLKILLLFIGVAANVIPIVGSAFGLALDGLGSWVISFIEIFGIMGGLWLVGAFRQGKSLAVTFVTMIIDVTPFLDDLPVTTAAVLTIIIRCRINDKAAQLAHTKKAAANDNQNAEQQSKDQAAQAAEQRALQQREQAMAISKAA